MVVVCILLGLISVVLGLRVWTQDRALRAAAEQLRALGEKECGGRIRMAVPNAAAEELLAEVNRLLALRMEDRAEGRAREKELRRQISNVSHDLRTPLTSILGYLQLLEDDTLSPEDRKTYLGVVGSRAQALQRLITSFYDLSRLEGGEFPLEKERVDLRGVLAELLASFYQDFTDAGFDMRVDLDEHVPAVCADPGGALRVMTNLLRNALDHGQSPMTIRLYAEGERVVSYFTNAAPDLGPEDARHVFDRFFTSDKMRTGRNTGLGLAIVKTLAEQMGVEVRTELADGNFTIALFWRKWQ